MTDSKDLTIRAPEWSAPAVPLPIRTADEYVVVAEALKAVKEHQKRVEAVLGPHVERAHATWKGLTEERRRALEIPKQWESECKTAMATYDEEQEKVRQAEERRLAELARQAEEERRLAEAAALEAEGIAEGDEEKLAEAQELVAAPVETPVVMVERATPKVEGVSFRETWDAKVTDPLKLIRYVAEHPEYVNLLTPNAMVLRQLARSLKANLRIPGVQAVASKTVAAR